MTPGGPTTDPSLRPDLILALAAAHEAGEAIMRWFRADADVRHKTPDQPVTDADLRADEILADRLRGARPDYGWLSEETTDHPARLERTRAWIVDPLDGTRSFIAGHREFAVSVALVEDGEAVVGVVYNPAARDVVWASHAGGAFRVRHWEGAPDSIGDSGRRVRVLVPGPDETATVLASRSELAAGEFAAFHPDWRIQPLGSTAWKLAMVAAGAGHVYLSRGPKSEWDVAAGALLVEEAGGVVTDLHGDRPVYNRPDPYIHGILACPPALHGAVLERARREPAPRLKAAEERIAAARRVASPGNGGG